MSGGVSKLGAALIAVFAVCLLILVADLLYVFCRRRRFHRRSSGDSVLAGDSSSLYVLSSKELLYFFCWKNQSARIEPNEVNIINVIDDPTLHHHRDHDHRYSDQTAEIEVDVMKLHEQGVYGPSRLLFTIKEEEEAESQRSIPDGLDPFDDDQDKSTVTSTDDVAITGAVELDDATPFSTPCGSPPYYTPSPSPSREEVKMSTMVHESYGVSAGREEVPFVSLEIVGV